VLFVSEQDRVVVRIGDFHFAARRVRRVPEADGLEPGILERAKERVEVLEEEVEQQRELRDPAAAAGSTSAGQYPGHSAWPTRPMRGRGRTVLQKSPAVHRTPATLRCP
jgi:hypothetical protein